MQLDNLISEHFRISDYQKSALKKLGIVSIGDILYHFPSRYGDVSDSKTISSLVKGDMAVIFGTISGLKTSKAFHKRIPMADGMIDDGTGKIKAVWFNQPYIAKMYGDNSIVRAEGKVSERRGELYLSNPKLEKVSKIPNDIGDSLFGNDGEKHPLYPVYAESRGVSSNWIYHAIQKIFMSGTLLSLVDPIPQNILAKYNLPCLETALVWIHAPKKESDARAARKRFAFEEVFFIQIEKQKARLEYEKQKSFVIDPKKEIIEEFISRFPFEPTSAQRKAIETIISDFKQEHAMSRLLEGDVGSGKTAVAAATVYAATITRPKGQDFGKLQTAYMCPTEILAKQHFESFIQYFAHLGVQIGLITSSGCRKFPSKINPKGWTDISKAQLLKWLVNGEIPILIGTHALIQKTVKFKNLAYVIIDEQHRFGTAQRQKLVRKDDISPHLLSMTATPIPRTLALTIFGDLDLTLLDEMPAGRKQVITEIVLPSNRAETYEKIRRELKVGRQAYIICPRIDEPDPTKEMALLAKSVKEEAKRLKKEIFPEYEIGVLHSKMNNDDKEDIMNQFKDSKIKILVATSVVEVGVNVPNATVIVIEGAERFGLAQLHQLRGRVLRSNDQAYCYVFAETKTKKTMDRLHALKTAKNGFELAEYDLQFRGAGQLSGNIQWGISDVGMEALKNLKMVEAARLESQNLIKTDQELKKFPLIRKKLESKKEIHFE